jgi:hypothetical protein
LKDIPPVRALLLILMLFFTPCLLFCQIPFPWSPEIVSLEFYKQSTTWNWFNRFSTADTSGKTWNYHVSNSFQSNLLIPSQGKKLWKDENNFVGRFYIPLYFAKTGIYSRSWMQSDRQSEQDNKFGNHSLGIFAAWKSRNGISLQPYSGLQQSQNKGKIDWGYDIGLKANLINWKTGEYRSNFDGETNYDFYAKRQNYENKFRVGISASFTRYTSDSLTFAFGEMSKQYWVGDSIEQVKFYNRDLINRLSYMFTSSDMLAMRTQLQSRTTSYFNGRNIFFIDNDLRYIHLGQRLNYTIGLRTSDESQDNEGNHTDSRTLQTVMNLRLDFRLAENKNLDLDFSYVKLQYDTPDSIVNNDDRDEQRFVFNIDYRQQLSSLLSMQWQSYAYFFHQIYIFREQSLNNSWNRIYKLNPRIVYQSEFLTNVLSTQVLANYTVYDFEDTLSQTRSYVFRKYTFSDSLTGRVFAQNYAGIFYRLELEDKGSFYQEEFAQQLIQTYRSYFYNFFLYNDHFLFVNIRLGYTIYNRKEWRHLPEKKLNRKITNRGPYINLSYNQTRRLMLSANASLLTLCDSKSKTTHYMTGYIRLNYLL